MALIWLISIASTPMNIGQYEKALELEWCNMFALCL